VFTTNLTGSLSAGISSLEHVIPKFDKMLGAWMATKAEEMGGGKLG
jgi:hypothetical protein